MPEIGKIPLADALLIEDPSENPEDDGKMNIKENVFNLYFM